MHQNVINKYGSNKKNPKNKYAIERIRRIQKLAENGSNENERKKAATLANKHRMILKKET